MSTEDPVEIPARGGTPRDSLANAIDALAPAAPPDGFVYAGLEVTREAWEALTPEQRWRLFAHIAQSLKQERHRPTRVAPWEVP